MDNPTKKWSVDEFSDWLKNSAVELEAAQAQNQREVDSIVIRSVMDLLKQGMTLDAAGDEILRGDKLCGKRNGVRITRDYVKRSLRSIGWKSKDERKEGVEG